MAAVASIISIMLFLVFASAGIQKVTFNPLMSASASRLGFSKSAYQRIGMLEILGGVALLAGLASTGTSPWAILNDVAAGALTIMMILATATHLRHGEKWKSYAPALSLAGLSLLELVLRLLA
jgi:uncharacterized membrane protein YphA (DoxX/SURF4 family)